ncbi:MAG: hypothetical protein IPF51_08030 [Dehalococcoidia bacterium]|nr:hypothetical protein [Dehalococcoidia bacterium]
MLGLPGLPGACHEGIHNPLFPNPVLAEGLLDRLVNSAHVITLTGRSYRPRQRPAEPPNGAGPGKLS